MKTTYSITATFSFDVDAAKPETMAAASEWIAKLQKGDIPGKPEGEGFSVTTQTPKISNKRDAAS